MKNKKAYFLISIVSIIIVILVNCGITYSKFTATSNTKLSLDFVAEPTYTYYFQAPPDWGQGIDVYSYMWGDFNGKTVENSAYPGKKMKCVDSQKNIYSYTLSKELAYETYGTNPFDNIIFSNGGTFTGRNIRKTIDLNVSGDINGRIFVPEIYNGDGIRTISYGFSPCRIYYWGGTISAPTWPGEIVGSSSADSSYIGDKTYYIILDKEKHPNIIFNGGAQTPDLTIPETQDLTYVSTGNKVGYWKRLMYFGNWHKYSEWKESGYSNWKGSANYQEFIESMNVGY